MSGKRGAELGSLFNRRMKPVATELLGVRHECGSPGRAGMMRRRGASETSGLHRGADWWAPRVRAGGRRIEGVLGEFVP
jgi:hypothetical protein